jgi:hypothetical protein
MAKSTVFLSGWEYNRLLSDDPLVAKTSGLPAQVLWDGSAQFWLFERVLCSRESLEGDIAATQALGWTTGFIFDDLRRRGFLEPIDLSSIASSDPQLQNDLKATWSSLKATYEKQIRARSSTGTDQIGSVLTSL